MKQPQSKLAEIVAVAMTLCMAAAIALALRQDSRSNPLVQQKGGGQPITLPGFLQRGPTPTPLAQGGEKIIVTIERVQQLAVGTRVDGTLANTSDQTVTIHSSAFFFVDSEQIIYRTENGNSTTLAPGQTTTFDLSCPAPHDRTLTLRFTIPPDGEQTIAIPTAQ